ncbi:ABC transporter permease [Aquimarina sp. ERC-38]|uniref:ABC transporter permease n=1 Tax=Aquimarina sp. ERC-38 TaxID=2949996 RepID=UPI00224779F6|nr:ABC transporter permease [Aquimarina sp. ERC-38]UZO81026.1 ABC transporter permease [Aquimarina sp. ERC-38]
MLKIFQTVSYALLTLFGVITVIFLLFTILPGDPAQMMLGQNESKEQIAIVNKKYGFDQPLSTQYAWYLNDLSPLSFHSTNKDHFTFFSEEKYNGVKFFNLGTTQVVLKYPYLRESFQKNGKQVIEVISETLPNTILLAISAISIAMLLGILMGIISALYKNTWIDRTLQIISTIGMSVPSFFSSILFAWVFGFILHKYTHLNMTGSLYEVDDFGNGSYIQLKNLMLPAIVLGIRPLAVVTQLMRNSLLEVLSQDYIRTARAKGLSPFQVIWKHAIKNSLNPVITAISGWFASMLAGAVFVEYIFGWNGIGKEIVDALNTSDLPIIMGAVIVIASLFILINISVDLIYRLLDPRIRV